MAKRRVKKLRKDGVKQHYWVGRKRRARRGKVVRRKLFRQSVVQESALPGTPLFALDRRRERVNQNQDPDSASYALSHYFRDLNVAHHSLKQLEQNDKGFANNPEARQLLRRISDERAEVISAVRAILKDEPVPSPLADSLASKGLDVKSLVRQFSSIKNPYVKKQIALERFGSEVGL